MQIINLEPAQGFVPYDKAAAQPYLVTLAAALSLLRRLISAAASDACAMDLVKSFPAAQGAAGNKAAGYILGYSLQHQDITSAAQSAADEARTGYIQLRSNICA